jgi:hypothetical protein
MSSLPATQANDSAAAVKKFFDTYNRESIAFSSNEVDAVIGYFLKRGFDQTSAISTAGVLLQQAKADNISVQKLIDTLDGLTDVKLSNAVGIILNINRPKTSQLGYKTEIGGLMFEQRNIVV